MDFKKLKDEAVKLKNKAVEASKDAVEYSAGKLADSKMTIKKLEDLETFIKKSETTHGKDASTGKKKDFLHRVIVIFVDIKSDFFKELLYKLPVLSTKAFSQNISLKLADISMKDLDRNKYKIEESESLIVLENKEVIKSLIGKEKIQKVVKSLSLDINTSIEEL